MTLPSTVQTEMPYCMSEVSPAKPFSVTAIRKSSMSWTELLFSLAY